MNVLDRMRLFVLRGHLTADIEQRPAGGVGDEVQVEIALRRHALGILWTAWAGSSPRPIVRLGHTGSSRTFNSGSHCGENAAHRRWGCGEQRPSSGYSTSFT